MKLFSQNNQLMTEGSIPRHLIRFAIPLLIGNFLQQSYQLVDMIIVGRCIGDGGISIAAVGVGTSFLGMMIGLFVGLSTGAGLVISRAYGAGRTKRVKHSIQVALLLAAAVAVLITVAAIGSCNWILTLLHTTEDIFDLASLYLKIYALGFVPQLVYNMGTSVLQALGNSTSPLTFLAVSALLNIVLDIWFVVGLHMGVRGAAWSTVIAQAAAGIGIGVYAIGKLPILHRDKTSVKWNPHRLWEIIVNDVATGIQQSVMNFGILMIQGLVNSFGTTIMASFAAAVKIDTIAYMPAQEFGNAYSLFVSQNYGAQKTDRIRKGTKIALLASACFCVGISVLIFTFAERLMGMFIDPSEAEIITEGARYLRIEGTMYVGIGILFLWYGYFRGIHRPQISLILTVISLGTRVALSYALAPRTPLDVVAIWCSIPIGWLLADMAGLLFYRRNHFISE